MARGTHNVGIRSLYIYVSDNEVRGTWLISCLVNESEESGNEITKSDADSHLTSIVVDG